MEDLLPYLWELKSIPSKEPPTPVIMAGAICVRDTGVLATVAHGVKPDAAYYESSQVVASSLSEEGDFRPVKFYRKMLFPSFGIYFFTITKEDKDEKFRAFALNDEKPVDAGVEVFSYVVPDGYPRSFLSGRVCYTSDFEITPPPTESHIFTSDPSYEPMDNGKVLSGKMYELSARTDYSVLIQGEGLRNSLAKLNPSLPFIQIHGFNETTYGGYCGWPVFTADRRLVRLIAISSGFYQFLIPTQVLKLVFDHNIAPQASEMAYQRRSKRRGEGSSRP